jgi:hypothetical protein
MKTITARSTTFQRLRTLYSPAKFQDWQATRRSLSVVADDLSFLVSYETTLGKQLLTFVRNVLSSCSAQEGWGRVLLDCLTLQMKARRKSTKTYNTYQLSHVYIATSWWWPLTSPKHVDVWWLNKLKINSEPSWFHYTLVLLNNNNHHHHQGLGHLARSVSIVTAALANFSSVFQLFSFLVDCSGMILKGFGFVAFFAGVTASSFCIHLSCLVCIQSVVRGVLSRLFYGH